MFEGSDDSAADLSGGKLSQRTAKLSGESGVTMLPPHAITSHVYPDFNNQTSSKRSSASYETERSLAEIESGSITFHQPPSVISSHDGTLNIGGGGMKNAPSLHETHFSVEGSDSPLTILHPPGKFFSKFKYQIFLPNNNLLYYFSRQIFISIILVNSIMFYNCKNSKRDISICAVVICFLYTLTI